MATLKLRDTEYGQGNTEVGWTAGQLDVQTIGQMDGFWDEHGVVLGHSNG